MKVVTDFIPGSDDLGSHSRLMRSIAEFTIRMQQVLLSELRRLPNLFGSSRGAAAGVWTAPTADQLEEPGYKKRGVTALDGLPGTYLMHTAEVCGFTRRNAMLMQ